MYDPRMFVSQVRVSQANMRARALTELTKAIRDFRRRDFQDT